ncbi:thioredoxin domain-containing protein 15 [Danio aesculapii]|uniref:thioredoxin domain-containing protein 15 n=1 Tax=Danio aesculapii TaxID=1142201 RepID=UPI0024BFEBB0|nr:thioredoxin domain-containing protein 15 [Danio aesculapii]
MSSAPRRFRCFALCLCVISGLTTLSDVCASEAAAPPDVELQTAPALHSQPAEMLERPGPREPCVEEPQEPLELQSAVSHADTTENQNQNQSFSEAAKTFKVNCEKRNISVEEQLMVQVLNASQDLMDLLNANSSECSLVLFYTGWCPFSASLAPHFNALPRAFPSMHFLALDASQHSSLSTRFGTVAVPNILLFQGVKPMARFNQTERTLETLTAFISNQTGFEASAGQCVLPEDHAGPLPAVPVRSIDWLFVFSVLFILGFALYAALCTDSIRWLIPGQDHEHQE